MKDHLEVVVISDTEEYLDELGAYLTVQSLDLNGVHLRMSTASNAPRSFQHADYVIFLINPSRAASAPWLELVRRTGVSPRSALFLINEKENMDDGERSAVKAEVVQALYDVVPAARVDFISTRIGLAALRISVDGEDALERPLKQALHAFLSGEGLSAPPTPDRLRDFSGLPRLMSMLHSLRRFRQKLADFPEVRSPEGPVCIIVPGRRSAADTLVETVQAFRPQWTFIIADDKLVAGLDTVVEHADAVVFAADHDFEAELSQALPYLRKAHCWFVLDGFDQFPRHGTVRHHVLRRCREAARHHGADDARIIATSSFYAKIYRALENGRMRVEHAAADREVVVTDDWGLPITRNQVVDRVDEWLRINHGFDVLLQGLEAR